MSVEFTEEMISTIIAMRENRQPFDAIAQEINVSHLTLWKYIHATKLVPTQAFQNSRWNDWKVAKLREMWAAGYSTAEIGRAIDMSKNAVIGKAHRLHLQPRSSPIKGRPDFAPVKRRVRTPVVRPPYVPSGIPPKLPSVSRLVSIGIGRYEAPVAQVPAASQILASSPDKLGAPAQPVGAPSFQPRGECQWIEGDVGPGITPEFCGARVWRRSYCQEHFDVCYTSRRVCEAA